MLRSTGCEAHEAALSSKGGWIMFKHAKGFRGNKPPALRRRGAGESYVDSKNSLESLISEHEAREHIEKNFPKMKIGRVIDEQLEREAAAKALQQKEIAAARREKRKEARNRARKRQREQFLRKHAQLLVEREAVEARAIRKARAQARAVTQKAGDSSTGV
jgi:hypothetical protein